MIIKSIQRVSLAIKRSWQSFACMHLWYPQLSDIPLRSEKEDDFHLEEAMRWLKVAQDASKCGGVCTFFHLLRRKWGPPYRETTGYIIPTFLHYAELKGKREFYERAIEMGEWEIKEMSPEGAVGEPNKDGDPGLKIFNTGQVILGMCALWDYTGDKKYLRAARRSSEWLISNQDENGAWTRYSNGGANCIDTRVSWALIEVFERTGDIRYKDSAVKQLRWAMDQQNDIGWFQNSSLRDPERPWTHAIAYTISGLLECSITIDDKQMFESANRAAMAIMEAYDSGKAGDYLPGSFDEKWQSADEYSCLTGDAQMAIIWMRLYEKTSDDRYRKAAERMTSQLKRLQVMTGVPDIRGGLAGSHPISGSYASYALPNWAAKFFVDALMAKKGRQGKLLG